MLCRRLSRRPGLVLPSLHQGALGIFTTMRYISTDYVSLSVRPKAALVDDPVEIKVRGLMPHQEVTVRASLVEEGIKFGSSAYYVSDQSGMVDFSTHPSLGGTYSGIEGMGLFWSMLLTPGQRSGLRLLKKDVTVPYHVDISVFDGRIPWERLWDFEAPPITSQTSFRYYKSENVKRTEIAHGRVRGTMFVPPGKGPFPGVIDMFGTAGGLLEFRASLLASRGFTTLALPYFNYKDLPKTLEHVSVDYFLEAVDWFSSQPEVQPGGLGVGGVSKGGELSSLLATYSDKVSACVNITGPPHSTALSIKSGDSYILGCKFDHERVILTNEGIRLTECFLYEPKHVFPFGRSKAKFLVILAEDDGSYSGKHIQREISLLPEEKQRDFEVITYAGAGHLIEPPYAPHTRVANYPFIRDLLKNREVSQEIYSAPIVWGGYPKPHSIAQEHSWAKIIQFYRNHVGYRNQHKEASKL